MNFVAWMPHCMYNSLLGCARGRAPQFSRMIPCCWPAAQGGIQPQMAIWGELLVKLTPPDADVMGSATINMLTSSGSDVIITSGTLGCVMHWFWAKLYEIEGGNTIDFGPKPNAPNMMMSLPGVKGGTSSLTRSWFIWLPVSWMSYGAISHPQAR